MPPLEHMDRTQNALLWETTGGYDQYGQPVYNFLDYPIQLCVRWNDGRNVSAGPDGNPTAFDASVITNRRVEIGSLMWLGSLIDLPGTGTAAPESDLMIVDDRKETRDLKGRHVRYEYMLRRFKNTLPTEGG